jgi:hypothetical protein
MIESLLLAVTRVTTRLGNAELTGATGFFFERDGRLFLVTARHVVLDEANGHRPDSLLIELHVDPADVAQTAPFSMPLYRDEAPVWRQANDAGGGIDVVAIELDRSELPETLAIRPFTVAHLLQQLDEIEVGTPVLIVGFPLGFHDALHRLPVARQAVIASAFGMRFQGHGYFLTDARTHRGTSGAPVVTRDASRPSDREELAWRLLGVHSSRLDMSHRDLHEDGHLDLNCAWYADVLLVLTDRASTEEQGEASAEAEGP